MSDDFSKTPSDKPAGANSNAVAERHATVEKRPENKEIGGRAGPDPTRFGDWEKDGRCIDF